METPIVFMDEDANYCVIAGTNDKEVAEKALREQEEEWYGKDHEEKPLDFNEFYPADILYGEVNGEPMYYWGPKDKIKFNGPYENLEGFVCNLD